MPITSEVRRSATLCERLLKKRGKKESKKGRPPKGLAILFTCPSPSQERNLKREDMRKEERENDSSLLSKSPKGLSIRKPQKEKLRRGREKV